MNRFFLALAFALGLLSVVWVGAGFVATSALALTMTLVIGAVYLVGAWEVHRFRAGTAGLGAALADVPQPLEHLGDWLGRVPPALRNAVSQRVESERGGLPGLALTPYLIGLLVMLGMLGTFLGMVVTFRGAAFALEGSADLQAVRGALAAPIKGLGLAFGTSVAGVATSAMLGVMSAIGRRERVDVARQLDAAIATALRPFSLAHQRQEAFKALQQQAGALPAVVNQLQALMEQMERRGQALDEQLLGRQDRFHREASAAYTGLAGSVERSLKDSLAEGARVAGESLQPVVRETMAAIASESTRLHERVNGAVQTQLNGMGEALGRFTATFEERSASLLASVQQAASEQATRSLNGVTRLLTQSEALVQARTESEAQWTQQHGQRMDELAALWRSELAALRHEEAARGQAAADRLGELQATVNSQVGTHLATLGAALEAPMARLIETASEAPRAAAEVIAQLRQEMSRLTERDNRALQERTELVAHIGALLHDVRQTTGEQRAAIESLVASATAVLNQTGEQFAQTLGAQAGRADEQATRMAASATELAALGEAFQQGVQLFSSTNEKLIDGLQRVEGAIGQSMARSDEQLAYYVAQAREVIDLSISAQQGIVEDLRRLRGKPGAALAEGAA